jgi:hypothetical protein
MATTTTTRTRAPSDWLIGELFSYTELKKNFFFDCSSMVKQVQHGISPHKSSPGTFFGKSLQNYGVLFTFFQLITRTLGATIQFTYIGLL